MEGCLCLCSLLTGLSVSVVFVYSNASGRLAPASTGVEQPLLLINQIITHNSTCIIPSEGRGTGSRAEKPWRCFTTAMPGRWPNERHVHERGRPQLMKCPPMKAHSENSPFASSSSAFQNNFVVSYRTPGHVRVPDKARRILIARKETNKKWGCKGNSSLGSLELLSPCSIAQFWSVSTCCVSS